ncbi:hypothetical protein HY310_03560, partial [Candidatus Microgenomates bacterium]|nr:hypothetical protein [Candidatus Microgenomates bacterium]
AVGFLMREHQLTPKNTLFGYSTCPDEINRSVTNFQYYYGEKQFPLGGLTGYPFSGKTGFHAFSHHVPDEDGEGNILVLYGPHVGVSDNGELGKVHREHQLHESAACGAAISFLNKYLDAKQNSKSYEPHEDYLDAEQYAIEKMLLPYAERIIVSQNPVKELVDANYILIDENILKIINNLREEFKGKIVLVGGVMINTSYAHRGCFDLRRFEIYHNGAMERLEF